MSVVSRRWRGRWIVVPIAGLAIGGIVGCDKFGHRAHDDPTIQAAIEKGMREQEAADRQMRERAAQEELARRDSEQAEIDARTAGDEARIATMARLEQRLRGALIEPSSMQIRNQRLAADGATLCAEFSAKNKQGVFVGFRRVVVSDTVVSFDQDPDDTYREPPHRFAAIAKVTGCY